MTAIGASGVVRWTRPVWAVLAGVALVAALALGAGCTVLEIADQESDKLLDKLSEPGGSSSSSSNSSSKARGSGLWVVERKAMPKRVVKDARGNDVVIWGQTGSASTTPGHARAMKVRAREIIGVRRNGRVDAFEVKSKSDSEEELKKRLEEGIHSLPAKHRGDTGILKP